MKKYVFLILFVLVLSGCTNDSSNPCLENEELVGDVCLNVNSLEYDLYKGLEDKLDVSNYSMDLEIKENEDSIYISYLYDGYVSQVKYDNRDVYIKEVDDMCHEKNVFNGVLSETSYQCAETNELFYGEFSYVWFELINGKFELKDDYRDEMFKLIDDAFDIEELETVKLSIEDQVVTEIEVSYKKASINYTLKLSFYDYGKTVVNYEEVQ